VRATLCPVDTQIDHLQPRSHEDSAQAALLERLRRGEDAAFEEMVREIGPRLHAVAFKMLGRADDAQDAVQDVFLNAIRGLHAFDGRSLLSTWLHRITVTTCLMKLRTRRRKPECQIDELLPRFIPDGHQETSSQPWKPAPAAGIEQAEVAKLVREKIAELPEQFREVLVLRDVVGMTTEETAAMLDASLPLVKTRLHRARQALKTLLDPYFAEIRP